MQCFTRRDTALPCGTGGTGVCDAARLRAGRRSVLCPRTCLITRLTTWQLLPPTLLLHPLRPLLGPYTRLTCSPPPPAPAAHPQGGSLPAGSPSIVASQRVSDYLTPMDGEAAFLAAANKPYAVYAYRMAFFRQEQ